MFVRELTGIALALASTILIFVSDKFFFNTFFILILFFLLFELLKITKYFNFFFWIQIFLIFSSVLFLPTYEINRELFFVAILIAVLTDSIAYYFGKKLGKIKIFPKTSPNKTLEGLICGNLITTLLLPFIIVSRPTFFDLNYLLLILIVWVSSLAAIFGDYLQSRFKRIQNIKDSGKILPGHGGISDRLDSHLTTLPVFFGLLEFFKL